MSNHAQARTDSGVPQGGQWSTGSRPENGDLIVDPTSSDYSPGTFSAVEVYSDPRRGLTILATESTQIDLSKMPEDWRAAWPVVQARVVADYDIELPDADQIGADGKFEAKLRCSLVPGDDAQDAIRSLGNDPLVRAWRRNVAPELAEYATGHIETWGHDVNAAALTVADAAHYAATEGSGEFLAKPPEWDRQSFQTVTREWRDFATTHKAELARATSERNYPMERAAADYWGARSGMVVPTIRSSRTEAIDQLRLLASGMKPRRAYLSADHKVHV